MKVIYYLLCFCAKIILGDVKCQINKYCLKLLLFQTLNNYKWPYKCQNKILGLEKHSNNKKRVFFNFIFELIIMYYFFFSGRGCKTTSMPFWQSGESFIITQRKNQNQQFAIEHNLITSISLHINL